ncbi:MAG: caspase family protein [Pseudanabaenaceae cyanobacterium bins.39]|nr:caspase family protein [Pseudanabaenaceae cyanobacterium bins.39]
MGIARRQFLLTGLSSLAGWHLGGCDRVAYAANTYLSLLNAPQRRKALLIGINQYNARDELGGWLPLRGCVDDVELQRELLIYRFGFAPQDVICLTDADATRDRIAEAMTEHLAAQTLPDDLVVVHFSGYGSRLGKYDSLVPVDSGLPQNVGTLRDITQIDWQSWMRAIATERIINVIDAGFYYPRMSEIGAFRLRSRVGLEEWQPPLLTQSLTDPSTIATMTTSQGISLRAASGNMLCAEWNGLNNGVFTYALVQRLWQLTPPTTIYVLMGELATNLNRLTLLNSDLSIEHQVDAMLAVDAKQKAIANDQLSQLLTIPSFSGDGVIVGLSSDRRIVDVALTGLPITVLNNYMAGSIFHVLNPNSPQTEPSLIQLKSRNGSWGKAEPVSNRASKSNGKIEVGQALQENIRAVSRNVKLAIALDSGLSKIERIDATSILSTLPNMFGINLNEQQADCLFGSQSASYGLFTVSRLPILGSFGAVGESVGVAIKRLKPFFEGLLAAKLLRLLENYNSTKVQVRATLKAQIGSDHRSVIIASRERNRSEKFPQNLQVSNSIWTKPLVIGDRLECKIDNFSEQPLYVRIFCVDSRGKLLTPNFITTPYANDGIVAPAETLTIPYPKVPMNWSVAAPKGLVEIQVIISHFPLSQVAKTLEESQRQVSTINGLISIPNPLQVIQSLLADLDCTATLSDQLGANGAINNNLWMLDVSHWAAFNFSYQVA